MHHCLCTQRLPQCGLIMTICVQDRGIFWYNGHMFAICFLWLISSAQSCLLQEAVQLVLGVPVSEGGLCLPQGPVGVTDVIIKKIVEMNLKSTRLSYIREPRTDAITYSSEFYSSAVRTLQDEIPSTAHLDPLSVLTRRSLRLLPVPTRAVTRCPVQRTPTLIRPAP